MRVLRSPFSDSESPTSYFTPYLDHVLSESQLTFPIDRVYQALGPFGW
jgi:hypothetical protein